MKKRHMNSILAITALALSILLIITVLPRAGTAAPHLDQQSLESLTAPNSTEAIEHGAPSAASAVQADAENVELVGHIDTPDQARDIAIAENYAYVAAYRAGLRVVDISDPANPHEVGSYTTPGDARAVFVSGSYAYVTSGVLLEVVDVSSPTNPFEVGNCGTLGTPEAVFVSGDYAYVATWGALRIIDVSDPANPHEVGSYEKEWPYGIFQGVFVSGDYAYVASERAGLYVVDVSDPANPHEVGTLYRWGGL